MALRMVSTIDWPIRLRFTTAFCVSRPLHTLLKSASRIHARLKIDALDWNTKAQEKELCDVERRERLTQLISL